MGKLHPNYSQMTFIATKLFKFTGFSQNHHFISYVDAEQETAFFTLFLTVRKQGFYTLRLEPSQVKIAKHFSVSICFVTRIAERHLTALGTPLLCSCINQRQQHGKICARLWSLPLFLNWHCHHCISVHLLPETNWTDFPEGLLTHQCIFLLKVKKICSDNRDFISFLLVSVGQQGLKQKLVALGSFHNNAQFILYRIKGKSSCRIHLTLWLPAEHSERALSKADSPAEMSVLRHLHTLSSHMYTPRIGFQPEFPHRTYKNFAPISL